MARSASIGVIICVSANPSNGLGFRGTTIVVPGSTELLAANKLLFTKALFPFGPIIKTLSLSETSL